MTMPPSDSADPMWGQVGRLVAWFDRANGRDEFEKVVRLLKLVEEIGEATEAIIGVLGRNPRKGVSHTWDDVAKETSDVIVTGMVALASLLDDPAQFLNRHLAFLVSRIPSQET